MSESAPHSTCPSARKPYTSATSSCSHGLCCGACHDGRSCPVYLHQTDMAQSKSVRAVPSPPYSPASVPSTTHRPWGVSSRNPRLALRPPAPPLLRAKAVWLSAPSSAISVNTFFLPHFVSDVQSSFLSSRL